ncbi:hypothetical protein BDQ12DRAFT_427511 [Crucibulum laeve]|uniref:Uncharacterized protein n=1 Tax=Crucibulum laeve TaxID=68775 RepID=A0A5C3MBH1_9AGAR|nr:hypothetical protein BDQ12DRAFT_427511 [Crucibulum laeve]
MVVCIRERILDSPFYQYSSCFTCIMMISLLPNSALVGSNEQPKLHLNELGTLRDAVEPFTKLLLILRSGRPSIRLHCTIPTWSSSTDTCLDLHDLNDLRSRFLLFIHDILQSLRSSGILATYSLSPSSSSLSLVCALPPEAGACQIKPSDVEALQNARTNKRENVALVNLDFGPCLVIT